MWKTYAESDKICILQCVHTYLIYANLYIKYIWADSIKIIWGNSVA